jgi:hypothetical protein
MLAVLWGRLEYDTRVLMPWKLVLSSSHKDTSKRGLALDYVSPNPFTALWTSARARDWPVFITALGSQLITVITVVSTGLFVLQPTLVNRNDTRMTASARFDTSSFNTSLVDGLPILVASSFLAGNLSVTYPPNTNGIYAIEPFNALGQPTSRCARDVDMRRIYSLTPRFGSQQICHPYCILCRLELPTRIRIQRHHEHKTWSLGGLRLIFQFGLHNRRDLSWCILAASVG